jgi:hypothetical protein
MFPVIEFNKAAFKHGVTEANIRYAMWHPLHEQLHCGIFRPTPCYIVSSTFATIFA